ncbi:MAG: amidohydrolase family protein, partial [Actinomycetota bacterium]|nr:amidohydrolase family protein [Actinomycetota bacterium]
SSGPKLLRATRLFAREHELPFALHVAESQAESELLRSGAGPLAPVAKQLAVGFEPPMSGPIAYLDRLGVLEGAVAVHCCQALPIDVPRLAATVSGVVLCPRSNAYLHNGNPPAERLARAHVPLGIGTDSAASNDDLDLLAEVRALGAVAPKLTAGQLLDIATCGGAMVLGIDDQFGSLEPGHQGDLAIFRIPATDDPVAAVVGGAGRATLDAVLAAGTWRIRDAEPAFDIAKTERAAAAATKRAEESLASA